jgi:hypothetical protein
MKKFKTYLLLLSIPFLFAASCKDDDNPKLEPTYEGCCGTADVVFTVGEGKVYVVNAFTPNGDGFNDYFLPVYNSHVTKIEDINLTGINGEELHNRAAYDIGNGDHLAAGAWSGSNDNFVTLYKGIFSYKMKVTDDTGQSATIEGKACSILCDSTAYFLKDNPNCAFPTQQDTDGGYDPSFPNYEDDCFGG